jgi:hypothetical protein
MTDDTEQGLDELREEMESGTKLDQEPSQAQSFVELIEQKLEEVEDGELAKTISLYDPNMAAALAALEEDSDRQQEVVEALQTELDREIRTDDIGRTEILKLAVRAGLESAETGLMDELVEAVQAQTRRNV